MLGFSNGNRPHYNAPASNVMKLNCKPADVKDEPTVAPFVQSAAKGAFGLRRLRISVRKNSSK